jgi:hypothetical protein
MRPASRRALLKLLDDASGSRGAWVGTALAVIALATAVIAWYTSRGEPPPPAARLAAPAAPVLDPVLALPFGQGSANGAAPAATLAVTRVEELRAAYRRVDDLFALYQQWRDRPETDARYLAFRAARDCERLRRSGAGVELEAMVERKGERERQIAASIARCGAFMNQPATIAELQALEKETADAGHPAAQVAYATDTIGQRSLGETLGIVKKALASGDPFAYDEARVVLAGSRHQAEIANAPPASANDLRSTDVRVVAIDIAGCRLGNPCGPANGAAPLDCGDNQICQRDAEAWLMLAAELDDDERRQAVSLAERLFAAFRRGAVDEIVRLPSALQPLQ